MPSQMRKAFPAATMRAPSSAQATVGQQGGGLKHTCGVWVWFQWQWWTQVFLYREIIDVNQTSPPKRARASFYQALAKRDHPPQPGRDKGEEEPLCSLCVPEGHGKCGFGRFPDISQVWTVINAGSSKAQLSSKSKNKAPLNPPNDNTNHANRKRLVFPTRASKACRFCSGFPIPNLPVGNAASPQPSQRRHTIAACLLPGRNCWAFK